MKAEEVRALDEAEVKTRIAELEEERFRLRFRSGTEALEDALRLAQHPSRHRAFAHGRT